MGLYGPVEVEGERGVARFQQQVEQIGIVEGFLPDAAVAFLPRQLQQLGQQALACFPLRGAGPRPRGLDRQPDFQRLRAGPAVRNPFVPGFVVSRRPHRFFSGERGGREPPHPGGPRSRGRSSRAGRIR